MKKRSFGIAARYILLAIFVAVSVCVITLLPQMIQGSMPKVSTVFASSASYLPKVSCSGVIEYGETVSVTSQVPLVIGKFLVKEGERVDSGQVIGTVDKEKTIQALYSMYKDYSDAFDAQTAESMIPQTVDAVSSGVVCRAADEGVLIAAGDAIAMIGEKGSLVMKGEVSEKDISDVTVGQKVAVTSAASDRIYTGRVSSVSDYAKKVYSGTAEETVVEVTVKLDEEDGLRSGYTATADITVGDSVELLTLPYSAICQDDEGEYVYVFENGSAVRKNIETGLELADGAEIIGISESDEVIENGGDISGKGYVIKNKNGKER